MGSVQMYQQQVHQQGAPPHPAYQGPQHFPDSPYDGTAPPGPLACIYHSYQVQVCSSSPFSPLIEVSSVM